MEIVKKGVLSDVVAYVVCCTAQGSLDDKQALNRKLESLGASVKARFGKGVTHVVFRRSASASSEQKQRDDEELRGLYAKAEKAAQTGGVFAVFVDPFWIEACASMQEKALENKYLISCPPSPVFDLAKALTPGSTARKKRKKRMQQPKPAGAYELDMSALDFSSTQQMMEDGVPQGAERDSTYPGSADAAEKKVKWPQKAGRPGTAPSAVRPSALSEQSCMAGASSERVDMQEAAETLLGLPAGIAGHATPSGSFVTPKPVTRGQRGQRGGRSATPKTEPGSSGRRAAASVPRPRAASARTPRATPRTTAGPARRRRSATSDQSPDDTEGGSEGADVIETAARPRSAPVRVYARPGLRPTRMRPRSPSPNPVRTTRGRSAQKRVKVESPQPLLLPPEEALVQQDTLSDVAAATGDQPADQPAEDVASARRDDLPGQGVSVPVQDAAVSWQLPQPHPPAAGSTEEHMMRAEKVQLEEHLHDNIPVAWPTSNGDATVGSRSAGQPLPTLSPAQQHGRSGGVTGSAGPEEPGEPSISEVEKPAHDQRSLPSSSVRRSCENGDSVTTPAQASFKENAQDDPNVQPGNSPATANRKAEAADRSRRPRQGFLSLTAVEEGTAELAAAAVKRLRRLRMCPEGRDEMATHLIVGSQKRTLKVMLAIAKGAWLLSPAWLTASLEAGKWQDEQDFQAEVAYSAAAAAARLHYEQRKPPLLKGESLHIVEPDAQTPQTASRVAALKRTATAHGAEVTGLRSCTLCVVMHGSTRPHQSCEAVTEDWLLTLAETFALPPREAPFTLTSR